MGLVRGMARTAVVAGTTSMESRETGSVVCGATRTAPTPASRATTKV